MCVTFAVLTNCDSCTSPISTNSGSMEAAECGQTRGACFITCRFEVVAVAVLLCLSWCVFGTPGFSGFSGNHFFFFNLCTSTRPMAARDPDSGQRRLGEGAPTASHSAHRQLALTYPHQVYHLVCSHLRNMAPAVDQHSSSQPKEEARLNFDPTSATSTVFFRASRVPVAIARATESSSRRTHE